MNENRILGFKTAGTTQQNYNPCVNILKMHLKVISFLRIFGGRQRNRWPYEVREDGRIVGGEE
jgi:hypothetical protein